MDLFPAILIISVIGGLVSVDTTAGWQVMISQPVVSCPVIGLIFGYPEIGLILGILLELPWLVDIPSGGAHGSEGNLGAVTATALAIYLKSRDISTDNIIIFVSVIYSLGVSYVGGLLVTLVRRVNISLQHAADDAASRADLSRIHWLNLSGLGYSFVTGFFLVGFFFTIGVLLFPSIVSSIHPKFDAAFGLAKYSLLGLGFGAVATLFLNRETKWHFLSVLGIGLIIMALVRFL
ncbi:MAG: PTS sugar transporter subunit IIC [Candidatus Zhuqueibacterota bacterium]